VVVGGWVFIHTLTGSESMICVRVLATGTGRDWNGSPVQQTPVTAGVQGLPEKAPCTPLPEQMFVVPAIMESTAASIKIE